LPEEAIQEKDDMWHPHLKKKWLNEENYEIVDSRKESFPSFIQVMPEATKGFLKTSGNGKKMECRCKFMPDNEIKRMGDMLLNEANGNRKKIIVSQKEITQPIEGLKREIVQEKNEFPRLKEVEPDFLKKSSDEKSTSQFEGNADNFKINLTPNNLERKLNNFPNYLKKTTNPTYINTMNSNNLIKPLPDATLPPFNYQNVLNYLYLNNLMMKNIQNMLLSNMRYQNMGTNNPTTPLQKINYPNITPQLFSPAQANGISNQNNFPTFPTQFNGFNPNQDNNILNVINNNQDPAFSLNNFLPQL
jgi:hypothetical protein